MVPIPEVSKRFRHPDPPKRGAWCFYCGKSGPWFWCDCGEALEARTGKQARPKYQRIDGKNVMVLEPDLLTRPWNMERLPVRGPAVNTKPVDTRAVNTPSVNTKEKASRRDWMRGYMRRRRAKG